MGFKRKFIICLVVALCGMQISFSSPIAQQQNEDNDNWKIGVARTIITPSTPTWMAGYAARTAPSDGKLHDLWAKSLFLEDAAGNRAVLITMDLLGVTSEFSKSLKSKIKQKHGLDNSQIILSSSHTHSGPVLTNALKYIYPMSSADWQIVDEYTQWLEEKLLNLVDESINKTQSGYVYTQSGITRFQVNRRNNNAASLTPTTVLNGPNDYAVPVIKIANNNNEIIAVVFGYACHPTVLSGNQFSGDYAGFAQIELEKLYPGATAMFFQGAGADQNPLPRHSVSLAIQYGKQLAAAVEQVLSEDMEKQKSLLLTQYLEIDLPFDKPLSQEELQKIAKQKDYQARWAKGMIDEYERSGGYIQSYAYPIGFWRIGNQDIVVLGGEVTVAYAVKLKEIFGNKLFVMAYANDVMGYIPSAVIIEEGRYEGDIAQRVYGLPAKWDKSIETLIIDNVKKVIENSN